MGKQGVYAAQAARAGPEEPVYDAREPVHDAAEAGDLRRVAQELEGMVARGGATPGGVASLRAGILGSTPLHLAAEGGHLAVVEYLVKVGADLTLADAQGVQPVHLAAEKGQLAVLGSLLASRPRSVAATTSRNETALHLASAKGRTAVVEELMRLEAWRHVDLQSTEGWTALHHASINGHVDIVRLLLARGAARDLANAKGDTPLHLAAGRNQLDVIEVLLEHGAAQDAANLQGQTPGDMAASKAVRALLRPPPAVAPAEPAAEEEAPAPSPLQARYQQYSPASRGTRILDFDERRARKAAEKAAEEQKKMEGMDFQSHMFNEAIKGASKDALLSPGKTPKQKSLNKGFLSKYGLDRDKSLFAP